MWTGNPIARKMVIAILVYLVVQAAMLLTGLMTFEGTLESVIWKSRLVMKYPMLMRFGCD